LENEEVQLIMAANGESGLKLADQESPDVMLLDMVLPDIQGMDVLKTIREKYKFPILMLTGKDSPVDGESATKEGATDYINKPFQDADLLAKIKQYI
jgi:DNA-binding response OmpR family regulator